jgi:hypothetical protein
MASYHHRPIKKFYLDGVINDDSVLGRLKIEYIRLLISEMKLLGYVPRLDIDPDFTIQYNDTKEYFEFKLSIHGVYTGKKKSECITGIDGTTAVYTQKSKSSVSLQEQESRLNQK